MKQKKYKLSFLLQLKFELWTCSNIRRCFFDSPYYLFKALPLRTRDKSFFFTDSSKHLPDSASIACMAPPITKHLFCVSFISWARAGFLFSTKVFFFCVQCSGHTLYLNSSPNSSPWPQFHILMSISRKLYGKTKTISSLFQSSNFQNRDQFLTSTRKSI